MDARSPTTPSVTATSERPALPGLLDANTGTVLIAVKQRSLMRVGAACSGQPLGDEVGAEQYQGDSRDLRRALAPSFPDPGADREA